MGAAWRGGGRRALASSSGDARPLSSPSSHSCQWPRSSTCFNAQPGRRQAHHSIWRLCIFLNKPLISGRGVCAPARTIVATPAAPPPLRPSSRARAAPANHCAVPSPRASVCTTCPQYARANTVTDLLFALQLRQLRHWTAVNLKSTGRLVYWARTRAGHSRTQSAPGLRIGMSMTQIIVHAVCAIRNRYWWRRTAEHGDGRTACRLHRFGTRGGRGSARHGTCPPPRAWRACTCGRPGARPRWEPCRCASCRPEGTRRAATFAAKWQNAAAWCAARGISGWRFRAHCHCVSCSYDCHSGMAFLRPAAHREFLRSLGQHPYPACARRAERRRVRGSITIIVAVQSGAGVLRESQF